jgi:hypothetical protein
LAIPGREELGTERVGKGGMGELWSLDSSVTVCANAIETRSDGRLVDHTIPSMIIVGRRKLKKVVFVALEVFFTIESKKRRSFI